mmetsp:Transcript_28850/g.66489  ORF Transcript_28850/g.66489 Transcript_28850/m.66489 type:complete len:653 (+) Transcript_28850:121-2079(+)
MAKQAQEEADGSEQKVEQQVQVEYKQPRIRDYFRFRPVPWWLFFLFSTYLLTKLLTSMNSPCSVLGTMSPVSSKDVSKAYRALSKCRHPDLLRHRLGREPTAQEKARQEIMFNQVTTARDELMKVISHKGGQPVPCYQVDFEIEFLIAVARVGSLLAGLGIHDYLDFFKDALWSLVTFEMGIINTGLMFLWAGIVFRISAKFVMYLWRMGVIRGILAVITTVILGPLPTVVYFVISPFVRLYVFVRFLIKAMKDDEDEVDTVAAHPVADVADTVSSSTAAQMREDVPRNLKQRKKKETAAESDNKNKELLSGTGDATAKLKWTSANCNDHSLLACVEWTHKEPIKARRVAAEAVQFDTLLVLTKPIIPLLTLLALGQVWNGFICSVVIGKALHSWVPKMSHEAHHILCVFFGATHTILGVSALHAEEMANAAATMHLRWTWSFRDVMAVMHMGLLGATVTCVAGLGNEPSFAASFAGGIALRMLLAQDSIRSSTLMTVVTNKLEVKLQELGVVVDGAEEAVTAAFDDCGGGPFRMLFGDGPQARVVSLGVKCWLMAIPVLAAMQWFRRMLVARRVLGKKFKRVRLVQRVILLLVAVVQCILIARLELNAYNGPLANFWVAMLFGCCIESLMSTYDLRGPMRQLIFLLLFIVV